MTSPAVLERGRGMRSSLSGALFQCGLFVTLLCAFVPFAPAMPGAGLDTSWMVGMNEAVARGLVIGQSVLFTFGPYAALYSRTYHPALDHHMLLAGAVVALGCYLCIRELLAGSERWLATAVVAWLIWFSYSMDALLIGTVLLTALFAWQVSFVRPAVARGPLRLLEVALVFSALGLLTLVKATLIVLAGPVLVLSVAAFWLAGRRRLALTSVAAFVFGMVFFWALARQPLSAIPSYVFGSMFVISGYTDAMSIWGDPWEVAAYWAAALVGLLAILRHGFPTRVQRLLLGAMFGLVLLTASKSGFVRHDFHATIAAATLLFALMLLRLLVPTRAAALALVLALGVAFLFDSTYVHTSTSSLSDRATALYGSLRTGLHQRTATDGLSAQFKEVMASLDRTGAVRRIGGSSDIYSSDQTHLIAAGNTWSPRPVFQSYSVYNPTLAEMNRRHLTDASAPDHLFVRIEPIDGHFPLMEDGPSWTEFLTRYRPEALDGDLLLLAKRPVPAPVAPAPEQHIDATLGVPTKIPDAAALIHARIEVHKTLLGSLASFLFKTGFLQMTVKTDDGVAHTYRLVAGMARAGFILSPLVENVGEATRLFRPRGALDHQRVRSVTIDFPPDAAWPEKWFWRSTYEIDWRAFDVQGEVDLSEVLHVKAAVAGLPAPLQPPIDCLASIDLVNDQRDLTHLSADSILKIDGWMDQGSTTMPERKVFVMLTDRERQRRYIPASATPRPDVAAYLKRPELSDAGYTATTDVSELDGALTIGLAYETGGRLTPCRQLAIPLTLTHTRR